MIKKILAIKDFGVFKDFNWNRDNTLQIFREKNIIYGWNYSGKTTLSRIFTSLLNKRIHPDHSSAYFKLLLDDDTEIDSNELDEPLPKVMVFNKEYIDSNLTWDSSKKLGEPIAFDVGENIEIRNEIKHIEEKLEKIEKRSLKHNPIIEDYQEFDKKKFTAVSKEISLVVYGTTKQFNKGHFKTIQREIGTELTGHIISDNLAIEKLEKKSIAKNTFTAKYLFSFTHKFTQLKNEVENLLNQESPKDEVIDILENNRSLYAWVKNGLSFEENEKKCSYCGNNIDTERIDKLNRYFSNASKELRILLDSTAKEIDVAISSIKSFLAPASKLEYIESVQNSIELSISSLETIKSDYINSLNALKSELRRKEDGNMFTPIPIKTISSPEDKLSSWIKTINEAIKEHNNFIGNFDTEQQSSRTLLAKHLVANYLISESYFEKKEKKEKANKCISLYKSLSIKLNTKLEEKISSLKTITKGKEELNKFIKKFLNRDDIKINVTGDEKFILLRGSRPAKNLSEGEKTAIAFSYFLVALESIGIDNMRETIVYIDDPISSLDNNHIAQVYSLINSFFFRKGIDQENLDKVINCFRQLFISTHSFEFFSFLKDSGQLNKKKKIVNPSDSTKKIQVPTCSFYNIQKITPDESSIKMLPRALRLYKSEYIHLFDIIFGYKTAIANGEDQNDILIPNALRRFLEIYTLMKIPHESGSVENRIKKLVDDVHQFKLLNHFSHFTTFEKATKHDELIMILPQACDELFNLLEQDDTHYKSLLKAIGQ